jgi:prefoldin subunit 5
MFIRILSPKEYEDSLQRMVSTLTELESEIILLRRKARTIHILDIYSYKTYAQLNEAADRLSDSARKLNEEISRTQKRGYMLAFTKPAWVDKFQELVRKLPDTLRNR